MVLLGDLIDRGPGLPTVKYVRESKNTHTIRGNHEQMMIDGFDEKSFFKDLNPDSEFGIIMEVLTQKHHTSGCTGAKSERMRKRQKTSNGCNNLPLR